MRKAAPIAIAAADGVLDQLFTFIWLIAAVTFISVGVGTLVIGVGFFVLAFFVLGTTWYLGAETRRAGAAYGLDLPTAPRPMTPRRGWLRPISQAWLDVKSPLWWRTLVHHLLTGGLGLITVSVLTYLVGGGIAELLSPLIPHPTPSALPTTWLGWLPAVAPVVAIPLGLVFLAIAGVLLVGAYHAHRALTRALLQPSDAELLRQQLRQASAQRDGAVRTVDGDRRRIERDLHDGVQPQLVNVGMLLSMAQSKLDTDPDTARTLIAEAHAGTKTAITDLRQLGRGIHPAVLTDSGLDAALTALVAQFALPTTLSVDLPRRCRPEVEGAAYFTVAEALTNAAKHAGATACAVRVRLSDAADTPALAVDIADNGHGGAAIVPHGGLAGLHDRMVALGGTLAVTSGHQGTTVSAVLPCA